MHIRLYACRMRTEGDIAAVRYNLGLRIRKLRRGQHLSQYTFCRMISIDRSYFIGVEKGRRNISVDNLTKIAHGLGVPVAELFRDVDTPEALERHRKLTEKLLLEAAKKQDERGKT